LGKIAEKWSREACVRASVKNKEVLMADIRPLSEADLPEAKRLIRVAFGTFLGAPDPENFWADLDYVRARFRAENTVAFAAEQDSAVVGSNFATRWGSIGFFGPLTIRPDLWDGGIGQRLVGAACEAFEQWGVSHAGLFTFAHSAKHVWTYGKFGFYPRFLTAIMAAPARASENAQRSSRYSALPEGQRGEAEGAARELSQQLYPDLDLVGEIRTVSARGLGDTVLLWDGDSRLAGFAVCHLGAATEAGEGTCFVNSARSDPGPVVRNGSSRCSTPAANSQPAPAWRTSWPGSIWAARRPIGRCSGMASRRRCKG
jgi:predicted N-acetyltransferase YhbS